MKKYRKQFDYSYALGMTVVFELLKARPKAARKVFVHPDTIKNDNYLKLVGLCENAGIETCEERKIFNVISPKENCFVAAEFEKYSAPLDCGDHIVLVSPMNFGNIGTVMRTALGLGFENIALVEPCADLFSPETVRASMGALFSLNAEVFDSFESYRERFPSHSLYPFMLTASRPIESAEFVSPYSLVFGNEAHGLDEKFAAYGQSVIIPCTDKIDSLNLSVAAAIGMFEARKR